VQLLPDPADLRIIESRRCMANIAKLTVCVLHAKQQTFEKWA
jgi:hypothetical protein